MKKIIGVGSLIVDVTAYAEHLPVDGETTLGQTLRFGPGGKGNNQMTAAHRAGAQTLIIGRVGTDSLGELMLRHYDSEKMSTQYITRSEAGETGSAMIEVDTVSGQNRIIIIKGASNEVNAAEVRNAEADFVDCDLVLTQLETSHASILECKRLAKKHHKAFFLNPAPFQDIPESLFAEVDYLTPNETEAEFFTGIEVADEAGAAGAAAKLLARGVKHVVITMGKSGAFYTDGTEQLFLPGIAVDTVDTTGAGDAFNGALATAIAEGVSMAAALMFANCAGALSTTRRGTAPAMPYREEIIAALYQNYGIEYPVQK